MRLRRAENAIAALQQQAAEQSDSKVETRSRARLEIVGRVAVNSFGNNRRVNNVDNPQIVLPDPAANVPMRGLGMSIRQTRLAFGLTGLPQTFGGTTTADLDIDFYGGQLPSSGGRTFPLIRMRTARAHVQWSNANLLIGQESPLVSGLNPVSPAAIGTPAFAAAGNLWLWLPQVRLGVSTQGQRRVGLQLAVLAPTSGDAAAFFDTDNDLAERSMRPFVQARVFARSGEGEGAREVGCGAHQGWLLLAVDAESSNAFACDVLLPITTRLEMRGEFFSGQGLRGLGGGGIGQNVGVVAAEPLESTGGWAQINARPVDAVQLGAGCGMDHPAAPATRRRNDACAAFLTVRPPGSMVLGTELRRIRTEYSSGRYTNDHVTLVLALEF